MKAIYKGISHHKMLAGKEYDITIVGLKVFTSGKDFKYSFTYSSQCQLFSEWEFVNDRKEIK